MVNKKDIHFNVDGICVEEVLCLAVLCLFKILLNMVGICIWSYEI